MRTSLWMSVCAALAFCACGTPPKEGTGPGTGKVAGGPGADAGPDVFAEGTPDAGPGEVVGGGDGDPDPDPDDPTPAPSLELIDTVKTSASRAAMSEFLVKPAKAAADKRDFPRAIVLHQALVVARGPGSPEVRRLSELWELAGQSEEAVRVLRAYVAHGTDEKAVAEARKDLARLARARDPFAKPFETPAVDAEAKKVFKNGRAAYKKKKWGDALVYFQMGYALSPELPGFLRELGATYDKLGAKDKKIEFYRAYLLRRPFGKNADDIRAELKGEKGVLGALTIESSLPCEQVWVNRQPVPGKLPKKEILVAPGDYKGFCLSYKYEIGFFEYATVGPGGKGALSFKWAILVNQLEKPYGRISIEDARAPGTMMDLGISNPEVGVVVPDDGRALKAILKDDGGTKSEERYLKLEPGQRLVIKW